MLRVVPPGPLGIGTLHPVHFGLIVAASVALLFVYGLIADGRRKRRLEGGLTALAARLGGRYARTDTAGLARHYEARFLALPPGYAQNIVQGVLNGRRMHVFDHGHARPGRRGVQRHFGGTFIAIEHGANLCPMEVEPFRIADDVRRVSPAKGIRFESAEFRYDVTAGDERIAREVFHPQMIEFFRGLGDLHVWTTPSLALFTRRNMSIETIERTLKDIEGFLDRLPGHLRPG